MAHKTVTSPAPVETDDTVAEIDELEGLEEIPEGDTEEIVAEADGEKPAKAKKAKAAKPAAEKPAFGANELAAHVTAETGKTYDAKAVRAVLRALAAKPDAPVQRGEGRYSFTGPTDPAVIAVVEHIRSGEAAKETKAKLAAIGKEKKVTKAKAEGDVAEVTDEDAQVEDLEDLPEEL